MEHASTAIRFLNPPTMPQSVGYTQVVATSRTTTIYVSGQVALDPAGQVVGPGDLRAQTHQVFENLSAALTAADSTWNDVVKLTFFVLDITQMPVVREVRNQYINQQQPPASTAVEVRRLVRDEFLLEVEAIAVLPNKP
jgi:reactive intermediate/imine deaminase